MDSIHISIPVKKSLGHFKPTRVADVYQVVFKLSKKEFAVAELCAALQLPRSTYNDWAAANPTSYQEQDQMLGPLIHDIFFQHKRRYGARRLAAELKEQGVACCRSKARKIMVQMNLHAIQPKSFKPRTTESRHRLGYSPNLLLEGMDLKGINQIWVGDITYIPLLKEYAYLAILMDLYSRKIIAWTLALNMDACLVLEALKQAIKSRQPPPGLIHHSDRGGQYAAVCYRQLIQRCHMRQSMSRAADCYDNAFMESCLGTIKTELEMKTYQSLKQSHQAIKEYINYYNLKRRHSSLSYLSPNRFELSIKS